MLIPRRSAHRDEPIALEHLAIMFVIVLGIGILVFMTNYLQGGGLDQKARSEMVKSHEVDSILFR